MAPMAAERRFSSVMVVVTMIDPSPFVSSTRMDATYTKETAIKRRKKIRESVCMYVCCVRHCALCECCVHMHA